MAHGDGEESTLQILRRQNERNEMERQLNARIAALEAELAEARRDAGRYRYIRTESLIHWESGKRHNRISWPMIYAAEPVDGGNYRDRFDAAIDAARGRKICATHPAPAR